MNVGADFLPALERRAVLVAAVLAAGAFFVPGGGVNVVAGVFGGALISGVSYWAIKRGVDGLMLAIGGGANVRGRVVSALIMLVGRYALLALIAYAMIARLRLSPVGLLVGASVIPIAATIEVLAGVRTHGKV